MSRERKYVSLRLYSLCFWCSVLTLCVQGQSFSSVVARVAAISVSVSFASLLGIAGGFERIREKSRVVTCSKVYEIIQMTILRSSINLVCLVHWKLNCSKGIAAVCILLRLYRIRNSCKSSCEYVMMVSAGYLRICSDLPEPL